LGNGFFVDVVGYGMLSTWVTYFCKLRLLLSGRILEVQGRIMIPKVVVICFGQTGIGYGGVGLIRHHVGRLVGTIEHTGSMKAIHAVALKKLSRL
jgi:hypothetical protein